MNVFKLEKKGLNSFLTSLRKSYTLIAPVKSDVVRFQEIENPDEIYLKEMTYTPLKEFFFKKNETLFTFDGKSFVQPEIKTEKKAFFGVRKCDLNAIHHQDMVFANDPYYKKHREGTLLLGYHCPTAPSPYCFCGSLPLIDFFDLMFYDRDDFYLVEVGSEKGQAIIDKFPSFEKHNRLITQEEKKIPGSDRLDKKDISQFYDHPDWKKGVDICLSCGACTNLCPTCYCFETHDEGTMKDPIKSERKREWSSCQLQNFSRVAGDHVFRKERDQRFKHRIFHQLEYFKEKYGVPLCVGCGRCIQGCPTRIDFVQIINEMK